MSRFEYKQCTVQYRAVQQEISIFFRRRHGPGRGPEHARKRMAWAAGDGVGRRRVPNRGTWWVISRQQPRQGDPDWACGVVSPVPTYLTVGVRRVLGCSLLGDALSLAQNVDARVRPREGGGHRGSRCTGWVEARLGRWSTLVVWAGGPLGRLIGW